MKTSKYHDYVKDLKECKNSKQLYEVMCKAYNDRWLNAYDIDLLDEYAAQMGLHLLLK